MGIAVVHVPHFYVKTARRNDPALNKKPIIIGETPEGKGSVIDFSPDLEGRGIVPSMAIRDACRLCIDAVFVPFRRKECTLLWKEILFSLGDITLRMESPGPGTAFLDITKLPKLYKSEDQLSCAAMQLMGDQFSLSVKTGVSNSRFVAFQAALIASPHVKIIAPGKEKEFLSSLGIDRLPVPPETKERLNLLGLTTLGHIRAFPLAALLAQFGTVGRGLWELSKGIETRGRIHGSYTVSEIEEVIICVTAAHSREQIKTSLKGLLDKLCGELEHVGMACRTIKLIFFLQNKTCLEKHVVFHSPEAQSEDILRRIMAGLEWVALESPVHMISVRASALSPRAGMQEGLFRVRSDVSKGLRDASGFLKTKYGGMPVVRVIEKNVNTLIPDERFVFVEP